MSKELPPVQVSQARYEADTYMIRDPQSVGRAVIINIDKFDDPDDYPDRIGSSNDVRNLDQTLSQFGFTKTQVIQSEALSADDIKDKLIDIARDPVCTTQADVFMCVIMSYGNYGYFRDFEGNKVYLNDLQEIFKGLNCPGLVLKPKVFIMQACNKEDSRKKDKAAFGAVLPLKMPKHPSEADFLTYTSTVSGVFNWDGDKEKGSHFIQSICSYMDSHEEIDFNRLCMEVNQTMDEYIKPLNTDAEIPLYTGHLTKKFLLKNSSLTNQEQKVLDAL